MKKALKVWLLFSFLILYYFSNNAFANGGRAGVPYFVVHVKLAPKGVTGKLWLDQLQPDGQSYKTVLSDCPASGGISPHPDGQPAIKTPAGTHVIWDTTRYLWYRGGWDTKHRPATYFWKHSLKQTAVAAIHSGHIAGQNSHGCIRTSDSCAQAIYKAANAVATEKSGTSRIPSEDGRKRAARNFSMVVDISY
jgi:hypothetical protein